MVPAAPPEERNAANGDPNGDAAGDRRRVVHDPDRDLVLTIAGESPHVLGYKVWIRRPGDDEWTTCDGCEGDTADDVPDTVALGPLPDDTLLDIPLAVGGDPDTAYRGALVFTQAGEVVRGGVVSFAGMTSDSGGGAEYLRVVLT